MREFPEPCGKPKARTPGVPSHSPRDTSFFCVSSYIHLRTTGISTVTQFESTSMRLMVFVYGLSKMLIALREKYADVLRLLNTISASRIHT